jgi:hypothetical protein
MFGPVQKLPAGFGPAPASPAADAHPTSSFAKHSSVAKPTTSAPNLSLSAKTTLRSAVAILLENDQGRATTARCATPDGR